MVEDHAVKRPRGRLHYSVEERRRWMRILAHGTLEQLSAHFDELHPRPVYTVDDVETRVDRALAVAYCVVRLPNGITGMACLSGGERRHAEIAAVFDALLKDPDHYDELIDTVIESIEHDPARDVIDAAPWTGQDVWRA